MDQQPGRPAATVVAALEHMTGPSRGTVTWLDAAAVDVSLTAGRLLQVTAQAPGQARTDIVARLRRTGEGYEIEAAAHAEIWVNGTRITTRQLSHADVIEFGESGPLSRFHLYSSGPAGRKTITDILCDCRDYLRVSRQPAGRRLWRAMAALMGQLAGRTTLLFRFGVLVALAILAGLAWQQYRVSLQLERSMATGTARLDSVAAALARARDEALQPRDLAALRDEIGERVVSNAERLAALERRSHASARVIAQSAAAVVLLQGSYGFREPATGRMLRHATSTAGIPLITPRGRPLLTLDGDGPVAEIEVIGTGFLVGSDGTLVTNRHVALPWEGETVGPLTAATELEPVMMRFIAYLPGRAEALDVGVRLASDEADLALLSLAAPPDALAGLRLADAAPEPGDEIIVMGYPTGLRALLAQAGVAFLNQLEKSGDTDFWSVAARLAEAGHIAPLASRGIVGSLTGETIVYDAETTHGGSGGPVLDTEGRVVAVNTAILPEYGGSNLGVPAARVRALIEAANR